jgi:hypothetical protein
LIKTNYDKKDKHTTIFCHYILLTPYTCNNIRVYKTELQELNTHTRNVYRILVGKPEGKRPLGRPRHRWVDNIKMDLRETGWDGMDWIELAQDRDQWRALVNMVMNLRVP